MAQNNSGCGCLLFMLLAAGGGWCWYNGYIPKEQFVNSTSEVLAEILADVFEEETGSASTTEADVKEQNYIPEPTAEEITTASQIAEPTPIPGNEAASFLTPLHISMRSNDSGILGEIHAIRALINHLDKQEMVKYLHNRGISPRNYHSAMLSAIKQGDADLVIRLLACGTPTDKEDENAESAHSLLLNKPDLNADVIKVIAAADISEPNKEDEYGKNILFKACAAKASPAVMEILKALGCTYGNKLHTAAIYGDIEAATAALNEGCSVNDGGKHGITPVCFSLIHKNTELLKFLLSKDADLNQFLGENHNGTLLEAAIELKNVEAAKVLIDARIDVNRVHEDRPTSPLLHACKKKEVQALIPTLLDAGADIASTDYQKNTALHLIAKSIYNQASVKYMSDIMSRGANINMTNTYGFTPLLSLASKFHMAYGESPEYDKQAVIDALNELLKAGADPHFSHPWGNQEYGLDTKGYEGPLTPLKYAELCNATECIEILKKACAETRPSPASRLSGAISVKDAVDMLEKYDLLEPFSVTVTNPFYADMAYKETSDLESLMVMALLKAPPPCYYKRRVKEFLKHFKMLQDNMENINDFAYLSAIYVLSDWVTTYSTSEPDYKILEKVTLAFLAAGHDINKVSGNAEDGKFLTSKETPLITAVRCNNADIVRLLLELGANPNLTNEKGATARSIAKENDFKDVLNILDELAPAPEPQPAPLQPEANQESTGETQTAPPEKPVKDDGKSVSAEAMKELQPLYNRMAKLKCKEEESARQQKGLLLLLDKIREGAGIDVTQPETNGNTALHYSSAIGCLSISNWLLKNGANPTAVRDDGKTPLQCVGDDNQQAITEAINKVVAQQSSTKEAAESPVPADEETDASDGEAPAVLFDKNDTPTDETTNYIVSKRFELMATTDVTVHDFQKVFAEEVIELKRNKVVPVTTLHEKAVAQNEKWPSRAVKLLDMGVSGRRIEANVALVYKNSQNGKSISAYNKVVMLLNEHGKICGMSETISSNRSKLSKKFKPVTFTGEDAVFAVSE